MTTIFQSFGYTIEFNGSKTFFVNDGAGQCLKTTGSEKVAKNFLQKVMYAAGKPFINELEYRTATAEDFKPGTVLLTKEGFEHVIREQYDNGIFNCMGGNVVFTDEAKHYRVKK